MDRLTRWTIIGLLGVMLGSLGIQVWQFWKFVNAGPRFTALDGQELCERVTELERHSIGFQQSGMERKPCAYTVKP